jgi:heavy metal translocating P-type ATPase
MTTTTSTSCSLCDIEIRGDAVYDEALSFCCHGCHTVYQILKQAGQLTDPESSPLFQQAVKSGLISNPDLLEQLKKRRPSTQELHRLTFEVGEMWCPSCAEVIPLFLLQNPALHNCVVDYATDLGSVEFDPCRIGKEEIFSLIHRLGYTAHPLDSNQGRKVNRMLLLRFGVAAFCLLNTMMFSYPLYAGNPGIAQTHTFAYLSLFTSIPVVTFCLAPILRRFWASLQVALFGMETLVVIGVGSAFALSVYNLSLGSIDVYFDSLSAIVTLVLLGKIIEARAKFSARETLTRLSRSLPRKGRRKVGEKEEWVPVKELKIDDILVVTAGEKVVLDGEVIKGAASVDESLLTGECLPLPKLPGSPLIAGSLLTDGWLTFRVSREEEGSTLSQIIRQVEVGFTHKPAYTRAVDPLVRWLVPAVLLLAAITGILRQDPIAAITVLLISCPCAIGIAAPLAEALTMSALAQAGCLVRNRGALQLLGKETLSVFDKTGTLTTGQFSLIHPPPTHQAILKALVAKSHHPISRALYQALPIEPVKIDRFQVVIGNGLQGHYHGKRYLLGSTEFLRARGVQGVFEELPGTTPLFFAEEDRLLFRMDLEDQVRPAAKSTLALLPSPVILSGDAASAVECVAKQVGSSLYYWRQSPLEKQEKIRKWREQGECVLMLGDGINDAPALAEAHVGISVVSATDMSVQASDLLLTSDRLEVLPRIRDIARKGRRIVYQNLWWAFSYNVIGLGLALSGQLRPLFAAVAMVLSSLAVIANALRLKRKSSP